MRPSMIVAGIILAAVAATEAGFRMRGEGSREMTGVVVQMAMGASCPDLPEARRIATARAYRFAMMHPTQLPPWRVFMLSQRLQPDPGSEANPFATMMCREIIRAA